MFALLLTLALQSPPDPLDIGAELARIVDLSTPAERRVAALELAGRKDLVLSDLVAACKAFLPLPAESNEHVTPGLRDLVVPLQVGDTVEQTKLWLWISKSHDPTKPAPLLLVFHGSGGTGRGMSKLWGKVADELGLLVLAPDETGPNDGYEFSERERNAALAALRWVRRRYDVDENRIYASGVSRGGHLTWDLALRHPDLFAAIAPMLGSPRLHLTGGQNNLRYVENVAPIPIRDLQGLKDDPTLIFDLRLAFEKLARFEARDARVVEHPEIGHGIIFEDVDWPAFLRGARRDPSPERVVRAVARLDEAHAFHVEVTKVAKEVVVDLEPKVPASVWNALDEDGKRLHLQKEIDQRTARLEVVRKAAGHFIATGDKVESFRLLLSAELCEPGKPVDVGFAGKAFHKKAEPDPRVLLVEFAERFDRTFLPIASIDVP